MLIAAVCLIAFASLLYSAFGGKSPLPDGLQLRNVEVVKDGYVNVYIIDIGNGERALIDAGNDEKGVKLLAALRASGLGPDAVKAILLTHGDSDHTNGARLFPDAEIMIPIK